MRRRAVEARWETGGASPRGPRAGSGGGALVALAHGVLGSLDRLAVLPLVRGAPRQRGAEASRSPAPRAPRRRSPENASRRASLPLTAHTGWLTTASGTLIAASTAALVRGARPVASPTPAATLTAPSARVARAASESMTGGTPTRSRVGVTFLIFSTWHLGRAIASMPSTTKLAASRGRATARRRSMPLSWPTIAPRARPRPPRVRAPRATVPAPWGAQSISRHLGASQSSARRRATTAPAASATGTAIPARRGAAVR